MIVVDIETTGLNSEKHGIWQIGALDFSNSDNIFLEEARIDEEDGISEEALKVIGKTEAELRNQNKQSQKQLLENFFYWTKTAKIKNAICQNPQFDLCFLTFKARKYGLEFPLHYRAFDLHSFASLRFYQINKKFLMREHHSDMGLSNTLKFCGIEDKRIKTEKGTIIQTGSSHNALEDAKLTAEAFSRLIHGKNLLKEFSQYKIPEYLAR